MVPYGRGKSEQSRGYRGNVYHKKHTSKLVRRAENNSIRQAIRTGEYDNIEIPRVAIGYFD